MVNSANLKNRYQMFQKIIAFCCVALVIIGCDRISQDVETSLIPRSVLHATPDKFCVSMSYAGDKIAYLARKGKDIKLCVEDLSGNIYGGPDFWDHIMKRSVQVFSVILTILRFRFC
jgi:hypothetical protein